MSRLITQRRGGDSNPRTRSTPVTRFPVAPVQPLRHLSGWSGTSVAGHGGLRPRASEPCAVLRPRAGPGRVPGSDLPSAATQQWNALATVADSGHRDVIAPDHEVDVDLALVDALLIRLAFDREAEALA
jgi:hypothetical protein